MINKISKKYNINGNILKLIIFGGILLLMLIFALALKGKHVKQKEKIVEATVEELSSLMSKIGDNYSLHITEKINNVSKELFFDTDGVSKLYDGSLLGEDGILVYNNKNYILYAKDIKNIGTAKLHSYKGDTRFINDPFYNIDLIKKMINYCELSQKNIVRVNCEVKLSDYLIEYNKMYNKNISANYDTKMIFDIVYYKNDSIGKIFVDYTDANRVINNTDDSVNYEIVLVSTDNNDFSDIISFFKKSL